jgi:menaquinone-dependent protoporphyrinogen oxidase
MVDVGTLVAYATKYGCAEKCARMLQDRLEGAVLVDLGKDRSVKLEDYDCIVIGGSIYAGRIHPKVASFCDRNLDVLLEKKLGLFICCAQLAKIEEQKSAAFDGRLLEHAVAAEHLGYEYNLEKMDFLARTIIRLVAKTKKSESHIAAANIDRLADALR